MTLINDQLETKVQAAMHVLMSKYQALNQIADTMLEKQATHQSIEGELKLIEIAKRDVRVADDESKSIREQYRATREHASQQVGILTREATELLIVVMEKIERLEKHTKVAYEKLVPQIDQGVRASQMQQAYGK